MITFDLSMSGNTIYVPLYALQDSSGNTYSLNLISANVGGSGTTFVLTDVGPNPGKYQKFELVTSDFEMPIGDYKYTFREILPDQSIGKVLGAGRWVTIGPVSATPSPAYENPNSGRYTSYKNQHYSN